MPKSIEKYQRRVEESGSLLCVGLDPLPERIPPQFQQAESPFFVFNRWIIEQTYPFVSAYKPNIAFYEAEGERGMQALRQTIRCLKNQHPEILIIVDAKRGDMASTSAAYARAIFDDLDADAVTLHPYLGGQSLRPFLERADKTCIIVCRTSNPGSGDFQNLEIGGRPLWQHIAQKVHDEWNTNGNCMLVMGATYPEDLATVRDIVGEMPLLVPGIGAQGGDLEQALRAGLNQAGAGMIISASRSIIFSEDPGAAARDLNTRINQYRAAMKAV